MITNVILHLRNDLPVVVDLEQMPASSDLSISCTNVRTVDGKRPAFVHDRHSTFIFPLDVIRLIEAPKEGSDARTDFEAQEPLPELPPPVTFDEEPDEDLLARIRSA